MAGLQVTTAAMGRASRDALEAQIEQLKGDDRLKPVTVVPPNGLAALSLRRSLGMRLEGIVNVQFLVFPRLIEFIGSPALAKDGLRPLSDTRRIESIRVVLKDSAQALLGDVPLDGPALRSIEAAFADFDSRDEAALPQIAAHSQRQRFLVDRYREFRRLLDGQFYDQKDLSKAATDALEGGDLAVLRDIGDVLLYLPHDLTPQQRSFVEALSEHVSVGVLVGLSGDPTVDEHALALWNVPHHQATGAGLPTAERILQAPDAEEEIRDTIRQLGERVGNGQPLHRAAILYAQRDPYQRIAAEQLDAAGIPWNGRLPITYGQTIAGRTLLSLLQIAARAAQTPVRISWSELVAPWLSGAPIREVNGQLVPAARWNQLARKANLLRDPEQWLERLDQYRAKLTQEHDRLRGDADDEMPWRVIALRRDLAELTGFEAFVQELVKEIQDVEAAASWSSYTEHAERLLERYLGSRTTFANRLEQPAPSNLSDFPSPPAPTILDRELEAWDTIHDQLRSLAQLDELGATDPTRFLAAVERGLDRPAGRVGRFGSGVFVGSLSEAVGANWDLVFIVGAAERSLPPAQREDPLLPEALRSAVGLNGADDRARRQRSEYLAALWSADERQLSYPRADVRGQRARMPSRWLLESASTLHRQRVYGSKIETLAADWFRVVPSFDGAVRHTRKPGALQEYDLRSLLRTSAPQAHYLSQMAPQLRRGFELQQARRRPSFGKWDGHIAAGARRYAGRPHSPTALQDWAVCPYRYFLGRVLSVAERDEAEDELTISPLEKGGLVHDILDTFFKQVGQLASPREQWSDEHRRQLAAIADTKMDEAKGRGVTGRALLWTRERQLIQADLERLLEQDNERRSERGTVQIASEFAFGLGADPPVRLKLPNDRVVELRGKIDRIDQSEDGSRLDVIDYKTGRALPAASHLEADPVVAGQYLQLPIYAAAASAHHADTSLTRVSTAYWFITERGGFAVREVEWDAERNGRFEDVLGRIVNGIGTGLFPAHPGDDARRGPKNCEYCPYDAVCSRDRQHTWNVTKDDSLLADYRNLVESEPS